jgi:hypothetical protein
MEAQMEARSGQDRGKDAGQLTFTLRYVDLVRVIELIASINHYLAHVGRQIVAEDTNMEVRLHEDIDSIIVTEHVLQHPARVSLRDSLQRKL